MKSLLREQVLKRRKAVSARERGQAAAAVAESFFAHVPLPPNAIISGYWPIQEEMDVLPILRRLAAQGHVCALPCIVFPGAPLAFRVWDTQAPLKEGAHAIPAPDEASPSVKPNIVLVPMVAFDSARRRLGYGGGYYDRTLAALPGALKIGLAYACQLQEDLPYEATDIMMDMIITEKKVYA